MKMMKIEKESCAGVIAMAAPSQEVTGTFLSVRMNFQ